MTDSLSNHLPVGCRGGPYRPAICLHGTQRWGMQATLWLAIKGPYISSCQGDVPIMKWLLIMFKWRQIHTQLAANWSQWSPQEALRGLARCVWMVASETGLKLKFGKMLFRHNIPMCCPIILKLCTEHGSITAMLCAKFQNDWATEK